jgi:hypothetical protein
MLLREEEYRIISNARVAILALLYSMLIAISKRKGAGFGTLS